MSESYKNSASIVFTGDAAFDKYMYRKWEDPELISEEILDFFHSADHVVLNVEGAVSGFEQDPNATGTDVMLHTIDPAAVSLFNKLGADVWTINNNHIMDIGESGVYETLENAEKNNVKTIGAGRNLEEAARPVIFNEAGGIGVFTVGYRPGCKPAGSDSAGCLEWSEMDIIRYNIDKIKKDNRWCVVVVHGGEEFTSLPSPYTRDRYLKYLEMGADIVVGHHPHVPMNYELFPGKAIFYSLGNFIFDTDYQRAQFNTEKGVLLKLSFTEDSFTYEGLGIRVERGPEHIVKGPLPDIFCDVNQEEYELLKPLAAKMFIQATKRQQLYLYPEEFGSYTEEDWKKHFMDPERLYRMPDETLDFTIMYPLSLLAEEGGWKQSSLSKVKEYILEQM